MQDANCLFVSVSFSSVGPRKRKASLTFTPKQMLPLSATDVEVLAKLQEEFAKASAGHKDITRVMFTRGLGRFTDGYLISEMIGPSVKTWMV